MNNIENYRVMKDGIKQESTSLRPNNYSKWHRTLNKNCYAYDVDFVEYRQNRGIVGIFETKQFKDLEDLKKNKDFVINQSHTQIKVYRLITIDKIYSSYFVLHTADMTHFEVWNISKDTRPIFKIYNEEGYRTWIEML